MFLFTNYLWFNSSTVHIQTFRNILEMQMRLIHDEFMRLQFMNSAKVESKFCLFVFKLFQNTLFNTNEPLNMSMLFSVHEHFISLNTSRRVLNCFLAMSCFLPLTILQSIKYYKIELVLHAQTLCQSWTFKLWTLQRVNNYVKIYNLVYFEEGTFIT